MRSITNNLKVHFVLQTLLDQHIHIACITESWLSRKLGHDHTVAVIKSRGFNLSLTEREKRTGGGIAVLIKDGIKFSALKSSLEYVSFEWNGIRVFGIATYCILTIYRKQEHSMSNFLVHLSDLLENVCSSSSDEIIILGDFNVWFESADKASCDLADLMFQYGLDQQVSDFTRTSNHTLDLVFINPNAKLHSKAKVYPELIRTDNQRIKFDHYPVIFDILGMAHTSSPINSKPQIKQYRNLKQIHTDSFNQTLLNKLSEISFNENTSFQHNLKTYNHCLSSTLDEYAPIQNKVITNLKLKSDPEWMDDNYKQERARRRRLERLWKHHGTEVSLQNYTKQRDLCVVLANNKQRDFYSNLIASTNNQSTLFRTVSKLWGNNKPKLLPNTDKTSLELANEFNNFFYEKINKIRQQLGNSQFKTHEDLFSNTFHTFKQINLEQLKNIVSEMTIKTSPKDPLPQPLLKSNLDSLLPYMLDLVNLSLLLGDISGLKESIINPIIKKLEGNINLHKNYRPIVNLQFLSKVIEKVVLKQLTEHMTQNNLHTPQQFGYKKNFSTETLLLQIVDDVLVGFEEHSGTILIMLDMSSAFDTVDIQKLLGILENSIGLKGTVLKWFESFLLNRTQRVLINGQLSEVLITLYGVPQGSVLGPVLFNIYVRSLPSVIKKHGFLPSMYADDTNARIKFSLKFQYHNINDKIPKLVSEISDWLSEHFLKINTDKTEIILFCPPSAKFFPTIQGVFIGNTCVRFSKTVKLLGVILDTHLSFDSHVNKVVSESFYHLKNVSKIKRYLTPAETEKVIHAIVTSKFDYCNVLLNGIKSSAITKLQKAQNYAARLVTNLPGNSRVTDNVLQNLHWLSIKERTLFKVLLMVHKFFIGAVPGYFTELLIVQDTSERLLVVRFMNTASGRKSFTYISSRAWNRLPKTVRLLNDSLKFKQSIKTILFRNTNNILQSAHLYNT